jgi:hypothetical protein
VGIRKKRKDKTVGEDAEQRQPCRQGLYHLVVIQIGTDIMENVWTFLKN